VGIRPGEKLHEVMCPIESSHLTLEFDDHYVIRPTIEYSYIVDHSRNALGENGVPVAEGFVYSSDVNREWLTGSRLLEMLKQ
jgi:UDP-N-acetylglucosamine 4,6-dehydratase